MNSAGEELLPPDTVRALQSRLESLVAGLNQSLLGQDTLVRQVVTCLFARGHLLLEGMPGLGKTELVKSLSQLLGLSFRRVQFTPDLLPSDIIGTPILEDSVDGRRLVFRQGPLFTHVLLADEINRATPKTQSALLQAMQEGRATVMGETHDLPSPFFVLATQNPIELEGTYPLPEAQLDRFTFKVHVPGVGVNTLEEIVTTRPHGRVPVLEPVMTETEVVETVEAVERIYLPQAVANFIARVVRATHANEAAAPDEVRRFVQFGASPRAAIALAATARSAALLAGRPNVGFADVRQVANNVLGHRLIVDYTARLEDWTTTKIVERVLEHVPDIDRNPLSPQSGLPDP